LKVKAFKGVLASTFMMTNGRYGSIKSQFDKGQIHHIIPQAIHKKFKDAFDDAAFKIHNENLVDLPTPFHTSHRQYNDYVENRLNQIIETTGGLSLSDIKTLQTELMGLINEAHASGRSLNNYFRDLMTN
jgi:A nuclease family of the HNH/ENDO VII superfamily with conserved AHH